MKRILGMIWWENVAIWGLAMAIIVSVTWGIMTLAPPVARGILAIVDQIR